MRHLLSGKGKNTLLIVCFAGFLASCGTKKVLYNPVEVADLSQKLGIEIQNDDENMPLYAEISLWLGVPYMSGGTDKRGADCSGFAYRIYQDVYSVELPRTTTDQSEYAKKISKGDLKTGDLVFFATNKKNKNRINHVGIYLKDNKFIHASISKGVIVSDTQSGYYERTWKKAGRVDIYNNNNNKKKKK